MFELVPSIPVLGGRVWYSSDHSGNSVNPLLTALTWSRRGARTLHLEAHTQNSLMYAIPAIILACRQQGIALQVGGGIDNVESARRLIELGAEHLVIRSLLKRPQELRNMMRTIGTRPIVAGLAVPLSAQDAQQYWDQVTSLRNLGIQRALLSVPLGISQGPMEFTAHRMIEQGFSIHLAGGIGSVSEIDAYRHLGVSGVLVGKGLYQQGDWWRPFLETRR